MPRRSGKRRSRSKAHKKRSRTRKSVPRRRSTYRSGGIDPEWIEHWKKCPEDDERCEKCTLLDDRWDPVSKKCFDSAGKVVPDEALGVPPDEEVPHAPAAAPAPEGPKRFFRDQAKAKRGDDSTQQASDTPKEAPVQAEVQFTPQKVFAYLQENGFNFLQEEVNTGPIDFDALSKFYDTNKADELGVREWLWNLVLQKFEKFEKHEKRNIGIRPTLRGYYVDFEMTKREEYIESIKTYRVSLIGVQDIRDIPWLLLRICIDDDRRNSTSTQIPRFEEMETKLFKQPVEYTVYGLTQGGSSYRKFLY